MSRACSTNGGDEENMLLVGEPERNKQLKTPRRRWVDNIKMDLGEIGCSGMD
jgi:hypothetical protein